MEQNTIYLCRLCLKQCHDFETIEESHQEIFNTLLLILDLAVSHEPVVCKACSENLQNCLNYKNVSLQMKEHLKVENGCMFCHKCTVIDKYILLNSDQLDVMLLKAMMEQFFPELDLSNNLYPIICIQCYETLQKNFDFIVRCLNVEQQIKKYCESVGTNNKGQINLGDVINVKVEGTESTNVNNTTLVKLEEGSNVGGIGIDVDPSVHYFYIKKEAEDVKDIVKIEEIAKDDCYNDPNQVQDTTDSSIKYTYAESKVNNLCEEVKIEDCDADEVVDTINEAIEAVVSKYSYRDQENSAEKDVQQKGNIKNIPKNDEVGEWWTYIASRNRIKTQNQEYYSKSELQKMLTTTHVSGEENYQCQVCMFVSKDKKCVNRHMIRHQHPSELPLFQCNNCSFKAVRKCRLASHMETHKDKSREPSYKCKFCAYQSVKRTCLRSHMVKHKDPTDFTVFECYMCGYKTLRKGNLRTHIINHQKEEMLNPTRECDKCAFRTNNRGMMEEHKTWHLRVPYGRIFKCGHCEYEPKSTARGKRGRNRGGPVKYKFCAFESEHKTTLARHAEECHGDKKL